ncbi:hypothetical protein D3871_26175 [Noviherbaspirillum saxi]|uniref:Uncharacterized protein n=1 Tax=Noviherbaspirillum saxi TaxID=2320863 RepID=A0A3A3FKU8_9BURK|nr:hypothetical protein D3871_26175 [Noviherbaspirillum saxi]
MKLSNCLNVSAYDALRLLSNRERVQYFVPLFGRQKDLLKDALDPNDPDAGRLVKQFTEQVMHDLGGEKEIVADLLKEAGLEEPRVFQFFAVLSALPRLKNYPESLGVKCVDYLIACMRDITSETTPAPVNDSNEFRSLVKRHLALKGTDDSLFLNVITSVIKNMPDLNSAIQNKELALVKASRNILDANALCELATIMPNLKENVQVAAYEAFMDLACGAGMNSERQDLVIFLLKNFHNLNYETQKLALGEFPHLPLNTPEIVKAFVEAMPGVHAGLRDYADESIETVLVSPMTQSETANIGGLYLIERLLDRGLPQQRKTLSLIRDNARLQTPEILIALIKKLPHLNPSRWKGGADIQGKAYTVLKRVFHEREFKRFSIETQLQVIMELTQNYSRLSDSRRAPGNRVFPLLISAYATIPSSALVAILGAVILGGAGAGIGAGAAGAAGVVAAGIAMTVGPRSVRIAVGDQLLQVMEKLETNRPVPGLSRRNVMLAIAPAWTELASKVYPSLSEKYKLRFRKSIESLSSNWIKTMAEEGSDAERRTLLTATAPLWEAVLIHVYPRLSSAMKTRVRTGIVDVYSQHGDNGQQSDLAAASQRVLQAHESAE